MPEIAEVTITSQYLLNKLKGRTVTNINVISGRYTHSPLDGMELIEANKPLVIENIESKGKFMWFKLKGQTTGTFVYMLNTFGLSGRWGFEKNNSSRICFDIENLDDKKKYKLYFTDSRNFGTLAITTDYQVLKDKLDKLGPDFLKDKYDEKIFAARFDLLNKSISKSKKPIVKILMDQTINGGVGSGLGNYLVAECLYRAKISPVRTVKSLTTTEIKNLYNAIQYLVKLAYINNKTEYVEELQNFIDKHKQEVKNGKYPNYLPNVDISDKVFKFEVYGQEKDSLGNPVTITKIIKDRSTYWVPNVQK